MAQGLIRPANTQPRGRSTLMLFQQNEVDRYLAVLANSVGVEEAARRLGVDRHQLTLFARANILSQVALARPYRYATARIERLEAFAARTKTAANEKSWLPIASAAQLARCRLAGAMNLVLEGDLDVRRDLKSKAMLGLIIKKRDGRMLYALKHEKRLRIRGVTAEVLEPVVGYGKRTLARWAAEGLIACTWTAAGTPQMTVQAVEDFRRKYTTADEAAEILGLRRLALYGVMAAGDLTPIGRTGEGRKMHLFLREDVERLRSVPHVAIEVAAVELGISPESLLRRARRNGIRLRRQIEDGRDQHIVPVSFCDGLAGIRRFDVGETDKEPHVAEPTPAAAA
jgi:hypothetical protein